jgi:RNA polymerase primary sigma factor
VDKEIRRLLGVHERICKEKSRIPTHAELATALNITLDEVAYLLGNLQAPLSLDAPSAPGESLRLEETIEDDQAPSPAEWSARIGVLERLEELLGGFSVSHRRILALRYGLLDGVTYSRVEVATKTGLKVTEIARMEREALEGLRGVPDLASLL